MTGHADGTGLGLAIAREIVAAHGGSLELDDAGPDNGARFTITLYPGRLDQDASDSDPSGAVAVAVAARRAREAAACG